SRPHGGLLRRTAMPRSGRPQWRAPTWAPAGGGGQLGSSVVGVDDADVGQGAVLLGVVEPVAHDPLVRNAEADVIELHLDLRARGLVQQRAGADGGRAV